MPTKKREFLSEAEKDPEFEEVWDIKKIVIGVLVIFILIGAGYFAKQLILGEKLHVPSLPSVKGVSTFSSSAENANQHVHISIPSQQDVQQEIQNIQQQVTHLDVKEIASSSPEVQRVLKQLQAIPQYPLDQAKQACINLCSKL